MGVSDSIAVKLYQELYSERFEIKTSSLSTLPELLQLEQVLME